MRTRLKSTLHRLAAASFIFLTVLPDYSAATSSQKCREILRRAPEARSVILDRIYLRIRREFNTSIREIIDQETNGGAVTSTDMPYLMYGSHYAEEDREEFIIGANQTGTITNLELHKFLELLLKPDFSEIVVLTYGRTQVEHGPGVSRLGSQNDIKTEDIIIIQARPEKMRELAYAMTSRFHWYHRRLALPLIVH